MGLMQKSRFAKMKIVWGEGGFGCGNRPPLPKKSQTIWRQSFAGPGFVPKIAYYAGQHNNRADRAGFRDCVSGAGLCLHGFQGDTQRF